MKLTTKQLSLFAGAVLLSVVIYNLPRKSDSEPKKEEAVVSNAGKDKFQDELTQTKQVLSSADLDRIKVLEPKANEGQSPEADSLAMIYDRLHKPAVAAHYFELVATKSNTEKAWLNAAYRYFDGFRASEDSLFRPFLVQKAIESYNKVITINPANLDAKTDLGVCYTETSQPMQGIMMLREVIAANPDHENAQMNLGLLSIKSRQFEKGIERFKKVLEINPKRAEAYLYMGETYAQMGDKKKAIEYLEKYKANTKDKSNLSEVQAYIEQLKNS